MRDYTPLKTDSMGPVGSRVKNPEVKPPSMGNEGALPYFLFSYRSKTYRTYL